MATPQQKEFCVLEFAKTNAIVTIQRAFRTEFGIDLPHRQSIRRWVRQFKETGCLCKGKSSGRPRAAEEQVERIHDAFEDSPRKFTRRGSVSFEIPHTTVWRVIKRRLHMKPCKLSLVQAFTNDEKIRRTFCESMPEMVDGDKTLFSHLV